MPCKRFKCLLNLFYTYSKPNIQEKTMQNQDIYTKERKQNIALIGQFCTHARLPKILTRDQLIDCLSWIGALLLVVIGLSF
jgi:hypothetical protein